MMFYAKVQFLLIWDKKCLLRFFDRFPPPLKAALFEGGQKTINSLGLEGIWALTTAIDLQ